MILRVFWGDFGGFLGFWVALLVCFAEFGVLVWGSVAMWGFVGWFLGFVCRLVGGPL